MSKTDLATTLLVSRGSSSSNSAWWMGSIKRSKWDLWLLPPPLLVSVNELPSKGSESTALGTRLTKRNTKRRTREKVEDSMAVTLLMGCWLWRCSDDDNHLSTTPAPPLLLFLLMMWTLLKFCSSDADTKSELLIDSDEQECHLFPPSSGSIVHKSLIFTIWRDGVPLKIIFSVTLSLWKT